MLPNLADQLEPVLRSVIETGIPTDRIEVVGETPAATGETHTFEAAYLPVTLDDDEVVGVAVVVEDVTEQRRHLSDLRERYDHEREVAARLQQGLLPRNLPQPAGYEVAVRYIAGSEGLRIGGDWYDLIELGADRYAVVIGDVVGHGLDAAIAMTRVRHALVGLGHAVADPVKVLDRLDEYAVEDQDRYVATLTYGLLEPSSGSIRLSSAGHPPPLLVSSAGRVGVVHEGRGTPIGITAKPRAATTVSLDLGDTFVLYTDGVLGQRGTSVDAGIGRLTQVASSWTGSLEELANDIVALRPASEQIDDIALLILRRQTAS
jgi:serine phosphatase RsbU (regulator of sigma subunit)